MKTGPLGVGGVPLDTLVICATSVLVSSDDHVISRNAHYAIMILHHHCRCHISRSVEALFSTSTKRQWPQCLLDLTITYYFSSDIYTQSMMLKAKHINNVE